MSKIAKLSLLGAALVAVVVVGIVVFINTRPEKMPASTASSTTKGEVDNPSTGPNGQPGSTTPTSPTTPGQPSANPPSDKTSTPASDAPLLEPSGNFVSNHHPNLSGQPAPNTIQSVCNTTPGATCQISFTKDGVIKTLTEQKTDTGGATYWTWKLQDVGLTAGSWQVQAKSTLGGQTKTASDALAIEVNP